MKNELIIFAAAIALLAGCSKEEGAPAAERPCIRLSTGVEAATRATDVAFEEGDNFGLIVLSRTSETAPSLDGARYLNNGLCTQTAEGVEMPTVKYPEKSADFYAYYPYREEFTAGSSFTFTVQSDQSAGRNYTNSDLMSAVRQNVAPTADAVELIFSHRLTRLDIELMPGEGFAAADELKGATVTAKNVKSSCLFNLSDGSVSEAGTPADLTPRGNGAKVTGEAIEPMQLIVVPQTLAAGEILFEIALGDETFFYAPNEELVLDGGKYYRFEIRLNRTNVSATSVRITLTEIEATGKCSILIPSPNVAENHQFHNAMALVNRDAAVMIEEKDLTGEKLWETVNTVLSEPGRAEEIGKNAKAMAVLDANDRIYNIICEKAKK